MESENATANSGPLLLPVMAPASAEDRSAEELVDYIERVLEEWAPAPGKTRTDYDWLSETTRAVIVVRAEMSARELVEMCSALPLRTRHEKLWH